MFMRIGQTHLFVCVEYRVGLEQVGLEDHWHIGAEDQTLKPVFSGFDPGFDPVTGRV